MQSYINIKSIHLALSHLSAKRHHCWDSNRKHTIGWFLNSKQEGLRLVGFKYQKADDWLVLNSKQQGLRLVGFKYEKGYDWLDSKFHCSYLESRGEKNAGNTGKKRGKLYLFQFWFRFR